MTRWKDGAPASTRTPTLFFFVFFLFSDVYYFDAVHESVLHCFPSRLVQQGRRVARHTSRPLYNMAQGPRVVVIDIQMRSVCYAPAPAFYGVGGRAGAAHDSSAGLLSSRGGI